MTTGGKHQTTVYLWNGTRQTHSYYLLRITNRKSQVADRSVSVPTTSSDLERQDTRGQIFPMYLFKCSVPFDYRITKFATVWLVRDRPPSRGVTYAPYQNGWAQIVFLSSTHANTAWQTEPNFAWRSNYLRGKLLHGRPQPLSWPKKICYKKCWHNLFAVANPVTKWHS